MYTLCKANYIDECGNLSLGSNRHWRWLCKNGRASKAESPRAFSVAGTLLGALGKARSINFLQEFMLEMYSWLLLWNFPGRETSIKVSVWGKSLFSEHTHIRPSSCNISDSYGHTYFSLLVPQPSSLNTIPMVTEQVNEAAPFPHHTHWSSGPRHRADREGGTCRSSASLNSSLVQEVVMPPRMGLNPWEKMGGSKRIDPCLPFPPPPPSSPHTDCFKGAARAYLAPLWGQAIHRICYPWGSGQLSCTSLCVCLPPFPCLTSCFPSLLLSWD